MTVGFLIANWYWVLLLVVSGTLLTFPDLFGGGGVRGIDLNEAVHQMNHAKAVLIDVRDAAEFSGTHIAQAKNVTLAEIEAKLPTTVKNKNLPVLFICQSGQRSATAAKQARKLGYEHAYSIAGGMDAWRKANMPTVTS